MLVGDSEIDRGFGVATGVERGLGDDPAAGLGEGDSPGVGEVAVPNSRT